jgi:mannose-1-phosphate guanylyltransferase
MLLTRQIYGYDVPKQFAVISGGRSLLQQTLDRTAELIPEERTVVVVTRRTEAQARQQLADRPAVRVLTQPSNLGTASAILLGLASVEAMDPAGRVVVFPSDHYVQDARPFLAAVQAADEYARSGRCAMTVLGVEPDGPECDYGWMLTDGTRSSARAFEPRAVTRFVEKPDPLTAEALYRQGGLWNSMVIAAPLQSFWRAVSECLPWHAALFMAHSRRIGTHLEAAYLEAICSRLPVADLSRGVLQRASGLSAVLLCGSGWSDWGRPERVFRSLEGTEQLPRLLSRLKTAGPPAVIPRFSDDRHGQPAAAH